MTVWKKWTISIALTVVPMVASATEVDLTSLLAGCQVPNLVDANAYVQVYFGHGISATRVSFLHATPEIIAAGLTDARRKQVAIDAKKSLFELAREDGFSDGLELDGSSLLGSLAEGVRGTARSDGASTNAQRGGADSGADKGSDTDSESGSDTDSESGSDVASGSESGTASGTALGANTGSGSDVQSGTTLAQKAQSLFESMNPSGLLGDKEGGKSRFGFLSDRLKGLLDKANEEDAANDKDGLLKGLGDKVASASDATKDRLGALGDRASDAGRDAADATRDRLGRLRDGASDVVQDASDRARNRLDGDNNGANGFRSDIVNRIRNGDNGGDGNGRGSQGSGNGGGGNGSTRCTGDDGFCSELFRRIEANRGNESGAGESGDSTDDGAGGDLFGPTPNINMPGIFGPVPQLSDYWGRGSDR